MQAKHLEAAARICRRISEIDNELSHSEVSGTDACSIPAIRPSDKHSLRLSISRNTMLVALTAHRAELVARRAALVREANQIGLILEGGK